MATCAGHVPRKFFSLCPKLADYAGVILPGGTTTLRVMPGPRPTKVKLCLTNPHGGTPVTRWRTAQGYQYARRSPKLKCFPVVSYLVFEFGAISIIFLLFDFTARCGGRHLATRQGAQPNRGL